VVCRINANALGDGAGGLVDQIERVGLVGEAVAGDDVGVVQDEHVVRRERRRAPVDRALRRVDAQERRALPPASRAYDWHASLKYSLPACRRTSWTSTWRSSEKKTFRSRAHAVAPVVSNSAAR